MSYYNLKKSLGFKLDKASRLTTLNFNKKLKENNFMITPEQWGVINFLLESNGITQNQIGTLIGKDHTCVSRLVDTLIKKGLIIKKNSLNDKRINLIFLTELGKQIQSDVVETVEHSLDTVFKNVSEEEKKIFSDVLDKIIKNLEWSYSIFLTKICV